MLSVKKAVFIIVFVILIIPGLLSAQESGNRDFICTEFLGRPTADSITLNVIPAVPVQFYVKYAPLLDSRIYKLEERRAAAGESCDIVLKNLIPSTRYWYRLYWKKESDREFLAGRYGSFITRRKPGESFSFAVATDSHIYQRWFFSKYSENEQKRKGGVKAVELLARTIENIRKADVDFLITLGDEAQTHCYAKGIGSAVFLEDARERYRITRNFYEDLPSVLPVFFICGNHEGEAAFVDAHKTHSPGLSRICRKARMEFIPNPTRTTYPEGGGEYENYFAWTWGDVLFAAIDPYNYTTQCPVKPEQWTLGKKQLAWLEETLKNSDAKWKFIFCHQFVGGRPDYLSWEHIYGKGGVNAVQYGEQKKIHEMMKKYGGNVYFYGHDHIYADGVKDGIHYTTCGSWASPIWWRPKEIFEKNYNRDFIVKPGFVKVEVEPNEVRVAFIETDSGGKKNGRIAAAYTLQKDEAKYELVSVPEREKEKEKGKDKKDK